MKYIVDYSMGRKYRSLIIEAENTVELRNKIINESLKIDQGIADYYHIADEYGNRVSSMFFKNGIPSKDFKRGPMGGGRKSREIYVYDIETMDFIDRYPDAIELAMDMDLSISTIRNKLGMFPDGVRVGTLWLSRNKIKGGSRHDQ